MRNKRPRPTPPDNHRCVQLKADGSRCKAWRVTGLMTCIHHTPELTTKGGLTPGHQNHRKTGFRAQSIKPLTTPEAVNDDLTLRHLQLYLFLEEQPELDVDDLAKISVQMTRNARRLIHRQLVALLVTKSHYLLIRSGNSKVASFGLIEVQNEASVI